MSERVSECVAASQSLTHSLSLTHCQSHSLTHCRSLTDSLRLGLHMAEVEQKGKIRKWTFTGCDRFFANLPNSKPDSDDLRILELSTGWLNPNICTKILPTRHSRSKQDPPSVSLTVPGWVGRSRTTTTTTNEGHSITHSLTQLASVSQRQSLSASLSLCYD